ncbi:hypothetical protein SATRM34S_07079 [Streptomyces atroolivaceus]
MSQALVTFLHARLDEEANLARRCDGDGCGEWTADGHTHSNVLGCSAPAHTAAMGVPPPP